MRQEIIKILQEKFVVSSNEAMQDAADKILSLQQPSLEGLREEFEKELCDELKIVDGVFFPKKNVTSRQIFNFFASHLNIPESREPDGYIYKGYYYRSLEQLKGETFFEEEKPTPVWISPVAERMAVRQLDETAPVAKEVVTVTDEMIIAEAERLYPEGSTPAYPDLAFERRQVFIRCAKWLRSQLSGGEGEAELQKRIKKLEYMIDNGLGWKDMENDITYPKEL